MRNSALVEAGHVLGRRQTIFRLLSKVKVSNCVTKNQSETSSHSPSSGLVKEEKQLRLAVFLSMKTGGALVEIRKWLAAARAAAGTPDLTSKICATPLELG